MPKNKIKSSSKKKRIIFIFLLSLIGGLTSVFLFLYNSTFSSPFCGVKFSSISEKIILISGCIFFITFISILFVVLNRIKVWFIRTSLKVLIVITTIMILGISILAITFTTKFQNPQRLECGSIMPINGKSMMPGIKSGDNLWFTSTKYLVNFSRGLIVIVSGNYYKDETVVKRIIGLPGETIKYNSSSVLINNTVIDEPYIFIEPINQLPLQIISDQLKYREVLVPNDSYFVMGDNRNHSVDSRTFGVVKRKDINWYREDKYSQTPTRNPEKLFFGLKKEFAFGYFNLVISVSILCFSIYLFFKNVKKGN